MFKKPDRNQSKKENRLPVQTRLKIGQPGDEYEQEADRVADHVMRSTSESIQMQPMEEEDELQMKPNLQLKSDLAVEASPEMSNKIESTKGSGSTLTPNVHQEMSEKIGADFSEVSIHTDTKAIQMNQELGARAFTTGSDIYFNQGEYNPENSKGKRLLAHELTHVLQQNGSQSYRTKQNNVISKSEAFIQREPYTTPGVDLTEPQSRSMLSSMSGQSCWEQKTFQALQTTLDRPASRGGLPAGEDYELQMQPELQFQLSDQKIIQKQSTESNQEDAEQTDTEYCNRSLSASEIEARRELLNYFVRNLSSVPRSVRNVIRVSMCDFSLSQLNMMRQAGLQLWTGTDVPPVFAGAAERGPIRGDASYSRNIRTIFLGRTVNPGYLTHEMAHAWDHIRSLSARQRVPLDSLNESRRLRMMSNPGRYLSETSSRQEIRAGQDVRRMTYDQMFTAYRGRVPRRELAFGGASRSGYSLTSAQEFYAEGYTVFHGNSVIQQARLYKYARELYVLLHSEATAEQMPVPDLRNVQDEAGRLPPPR